MAAHVAHGLPDPVPLDLHAANRLSWELGSRIVTGDDASHRGTWEGVGNAWSVSAYRVTTHTDVVAVQTPVGREKFYGVAREDLDDALPALSEAGWRRTDNPNS